MCTVSVIKNKEGGLQLISNRDEKIVRKTFMPMGYEICGEQVFFPKDFQKGGSWIAVGSSGRVVCLLNGGWQPHTPTGNESKSRGQIVLDVFRHKTFDDFVINCEYERCEPFTLLYINKDKSHALTEFVWDGHIGAVKDVEIKGGQLWSSSTLYDQELKEVRSEEFFKVLSSDDYSPEKILELHLSRNKGGYILEENKLRTVSTTIINMSKKWFKLAYKDFLTGEKNLIEKEW